MAALMSKASQVATPLCAVALCYSKVVSYIISGAVQQEVKQLVKRFF